jgi:selenocysteine-specific elongation factor
VRVVGELVVSRTQMEEASLRLLTALRAHHAAEPLSEGLHREEARMRVAPRASAAVFDAIVAALAAAKQVSARDRLAIAGQSVSLTQQEERIREALVRVYHAGGLTPPDAAGARTAAGADGPTVDRITALLLRQRVLTRVDTLIFHTERLEALKTEVRALKSAGEAATLDVASFKQRYGVSRKFAIPLLEYLDRERITRRVGESRVLV